jgi:hypothetical protein
MAHVAGFVAGIIAVFALRQRDVQPWEDLPY